jgi:hypothetical protein
MGEVDMTSMPLASAPSGTNRHIPVYIGYLEPPSRRERVRERGEREWPSSSTVGTRLLSSQRSLAPVEPVQAKSRWRGYVTARLAKLSRGEGDFTGLMQPSEEVVERARILAASLFSHNTPTPSVVPGEDGEVLFIWRKSGWEIEIEVGDEGVSVWAHELPSGVTYSGSLGELRPTVSALLADLDRQPRT